MSTETLAAAAVIAVFLLIIFGLVLWARERSHASEAAAYGRVIASLERTQTELLDRMFVSKGHPPTKTDMQQVARVERERKEERRQAAEARPRKLGPIDEALAEIEEEDGG